MNFDFSTIFSSTLNPLQVMLTLVVALLVGLFLFFIYKRTFSGVMYSRNFNVSLVMLTLVTSLMLMLINNNLTLSLGMVGALSIIRFRTAVKDPIDTVFMFWAVGEGIAIGTKFYDVAVISALCIGVILLATSAFRTRGSMPYLLVIHYNDAASAQIKALMKQLPSSRLKSKTVQHDGIELTLELRLRENETGFVEKLIRVEGVYDAALISHQGDIVS
jgi:uncharacterized membrane protein YhiD involved in acid resistance